MWAHRAWQGRHLPVSSRAGDALAAYATWCTAVEGNTTFYAVPAASTVATWTAATPETFRFLFKLPRTVTHERRLRDAGPELREFMSVIEPLGQRAEQLVVQLPASFGPSELGSLEAFLGSAPSTHRYSVEVRHPDFFADGAPRQALRELLGQHGAEWVTFDSSTLFAAAPTSDAERDGWEKKPRLPVRPMAIGDAPVVRYIGRDESEATIEGWQRWIPRLARWIEQGRTPTFFVHTPDNDDALWLARLFHDQVRAALPDLAPLPEPVDAAPPTLF